MIKQDSDKILISESCFIIYTIFWTVSKEGDLTPSSVEGMTSTADRFVAPAILILQILVYS